MLGICTQQLIYASVIIVFVELIVILHSIQLNECVSASKTTYVGRIDADKVFRTFDNCEYSIRFSLRSDCLSAILNADNS